MKRITVVLLAALVASCIDSQSARNGAFRFINAVPDGGRLSLLIDDELRAAGFDYTNGSGFIALSAGHYAIGFQETLPDGADEGTDADTPRIITPDVEIDLAVNDEKTFVVTGAYPNEQIFAVDTTTRAIPSDRTAVQFAHAAAGSPALDVWIKREPPSSTDLPLDPEVITRVASGLDYLGAPQPDDVTASDILSGPVSISLRPAGGDASSVLFDSGRLVLSQSRRFLFVIVPNTGFDSATHPFFVVLASVSGSTLLADKATQSSFRFVNASPATYTLDTFVNKTADTTGRQACPIPVNPDDDFLLGFCALPYEFVLPYETIEAGVYDLKVQGPPDGDSNPDNDGVTTRIFNGAFARGARSTVIVRGLFDVDNTDPNTTDIALTTIGDARRIESIAQLRLVSVSKALVAALNGDPTTDRIDIFITQPGDVLDDEHAIVRVPAVGVGTDSGYRSLLPDTYRLTIAKVDPAVTGSVPVPVYTTDITLDNAGVYALVFNDTVGGVLPLRVLSLEDDAALTPVP